MAIRLLLIINSSKDLENMEKDRLTCLVPFKA